MPSIIRATPVNRAHAGAYRSRDICSKYRRPGLSTPAVVTVREANGRFGLSARTATGRLRMLPLPIALPGSRHSRWLAVSVSGDAWVGQKAVKASGRQKLIMTALWTEACLTFPALDAIGEGYEVYPVVDAVGGTSPEAHRAALERITQAGAKPVSWGPTDLRTTARLAAQGDRKGVCKYLVRRGRPLRTRSRTRLRPSIVG